MLHRGNTGDGCDLASTLCKYDLRKGDLIVLRWERVRRMRRDIISYCLLWLDVQSQYMSVYGARLFLCMLVVIVTVWGSVGSSVLCVLMVEDMSVVMNVMLLSVMGPASALCDLSVRTVVKLCTLGVFVLGVSLVSFFVMIYACVL